MGLARLTTHDRKRCRIMARLIALVYNWWTLFGRLADPDHHREALTSRPLLLHGIARQTRHAGQTRLTITASHGRRHQAVRALRRVAPFFEDLRQTAEQSTAAERWRRILSQALANPRLTTRAAPLATGRMRQLSAIAKRRNGPRSSTSQLLNLG